VRLLPTFLIACFTTVADLPVYFASNLSWKLACLQRGPILLTTTRCLCFLRHHHPPMLHQRTRTTFDCSKSCQSGGRETHLKTLPACLSSTSMVRSPF